MIRFTLLAVCFVNLLAACSPRITRTGYSLDPTLRIESSDLAAIPIKRQFQIDPNSMTIAGTIKAGDSGLSSHCDEGTILNQFRKEAIAAKAHFVNVLEATQPSFSVTCYRASAQLVRFNEPEANSNFESDPYYDDKSIQERIKKGSHLINAGFISGIIGGLIAGGVVASGGN